MMANTAEKKEPPSSSSSSPPIPKKHTEKEKSIYIRAKEDGEHECIKWYVIHASGPAATALENNIPAGANTCETKLRSISVMPSIISSRSACVACDSTIYAFNGGYNKNGPEVVYLDTRNPNEGWKIGPSMRIARTQKRAVVVGGEIYVMGYKCRWGGDDDNVDEPLWEVLDPLMNEWTTLVPPHPDLVSSRIILQAVHDEGKKVLIYPEGRDCRNTALYMYDVDAKSCEIINKDFGASLYRRHHDELTPCIVVDDILYFYERSIGVRGYDLVRHKWFVEPVRGLNNYKGLLWPLERRGYGIDDPVKVFLAHVGDGKLCLLWENYRKEYEKGKLKWRRYLRCTKFRVIRQSDGTEEEVILHALIDSFFVYSFGDHERILDCLAL